MSCLSAPVPPRTGPCEHSHLPAGTMLGLLSRGHWRDTARQSGEGGFPSWIDLPVSVTSPVATPWHSLPSKFHRHPSGRLPAGHLWPAGCTPAGSCSSPVKFCHLVSSLPSPRRSESQPWGWGLFQVFSSLGYSSLTLVVVVLLTFAIL